MDPGVRCLLFLRKYDASKGIAAKACWRCSRMIGKRYDLELFTANVGRYLYLRHASDITVNEGATPGTVSSCIKAAPLARQIEAREWAAQHREIVFRLESMPRSLARSISGTMFSFIVPNAFVNCDIPSHPFVIGNPCIIKHKEYATRGYLRWVNEDNYLEILGKPIDDHSDRGRPHQWILIK